MSLAPPADSKDVDNLSTRAVVGETFSRWSNHSDSGRSTEDTGEKAASDSTGVLRKELRARVGDEVEMSSTKVNKGEEESDNVDMASTRAVWIKKPAAAKIAGLKAAGKVVIDDTGSRSSGGQ